VIASKLVIGLLLTDAGTTALTGTRITPLKAPQTDVTSGPTTPYITVRQIAGGHVMAFAGVEGTGHPRCEVLCHHVTQTDADNLAKIVRTRLNGFRGQVYPPGEVLPLTVRGIFVEDDSEDWDTPIHAAEEGMHVARITCLIWHSE
jgi:hypothetical protein